MRQYLDLCQRIVDEGHMIQNERTGKGCLTVIDANLEYDVGNNVFPMITTRKSFYKSAIAEFIGYIRGYDNAKDFEALGTKTWNANANDNPVWLNNPFRKGENDMGKVYGTIGRNLIDVKKIVRDLDVLKYGEQCTYLGELGYEHKGTIFDEDEQLDYDIWERSIDQLQKIVDNLTNSKDDRFETITFYDPTEVAFGCLRPCMFQHTFSLVDGVLSLTSYQRSCDVPLGLNFNQVQVFTFLALMAQITGNKAGKAYHKIINAHIYEDQLELMTDVQLKREPFESPTLWINPLIKSLEDLETWVTMRDFEVDGYECHDAIKYPFSV